MTYFWAIPMDEALTVYASTMQTDDLQRLYKRMIDALEPLECLVDRRAYRPHVTLCRRASFHTHPNHSKPPLWLRINAIVLYESNRIEGERHYIERNRISLKAKTRPRKKA